MKTDQGSSPRRVLEGWLGLTPAQTDLLLAQGAAVPAYPRLGFS